MCSCVTVLNLGAGIDDGHAGRGAAEHRVIDAYLGTTDARDDRSMRARIDATQPQFGGADGAAAARSCELRGVTAAYDNIEVLHGIDLAVPPGQSSPCWGPNGAGKSTTLKVACGRWPHRRRRWWGRDVNGARPEELARAGPVH